MGRINFAEAVRNTVPLAPAITKECHHIVNVVATVEILSPNEYLCLESMALQLSGMIKYEPRRFAAAVLRIKDSISITTCLVFRSGKIVVVGTLTKYHSIYACHLYRQVIQSVEIVYKRDDWLGVHTLVGRAQFNRWGIWNIVAHDALPQRPDLKILSDMVSDLASWTPELFPGLKLLVWLKPKSQCQCNTNKKNKSCGCNCRALIFDSGKIVITGCKTTQHVALARERIHLLLSDEDVQDKSGVKIPKNMRFQSRRQKLLTLGTIEFAGWLGAPKKNEHVEKEQELPALLKSVKKRVKLDRPEHLTPLEWAQQLGQTENVEFLKCIYRVGI
jgi:TATA-box binding protein (TBP) (component of TFIID and TFIIIB)